VPQRKSGLKALRSDAKKTEYNQRIKNRLKQAVKAFQKTDEAGEKDKLQNLYKKACSQLDKAVSKNVIHKNKAARHKSQLAKKLSSKS